MRRRKIRLFFTENTLWLIFEGVVLTNVHPRYEMPFVSNMPEIAILYKYIDTGTSQ